MRFICLILARKNSKRIKNKNIKKLNHRSLVEWTIDFAKYLKIFKKIILSTDSHIIRNIGLKKNIECKRLRGKHLAQDNTKSIDVIIKLISNYKYEQNFILLQPTSPFRSKLNILQAINIYKKNNNNIYSACFEKNFSKIKPNGNFYIFSKERLLKTRSLILDENIPFIQRGDYNIDIDRLRDFQKADIISKKTCYKY